MERTRPEKQGQEWTRPDQIGMAGTEMESKELFTTTPEEVLLVAQALIKYFEDNKISKGLAYTSIMCIKDLLESDLGIAEKSYKVTSVNKYINPEDLR